LPLELKLEKVVDTFDEGTPLMQAEHREVEWGQRPYGPDYNSAVALEKLGVLKVLTARRDGELVGFLVWTVDFDLESYGTLIANQGAWYVKPGNPLVAHKMFDRFIQELRQIGVKFVYLTHSVRGRGSELGRFFLRKGAVPKSHTYVMKLGD
jgi:hypothetical protein